MAENEPSARSEPPSTNDIGAVARRAAAMAAERAGAARGRGDEAAEPHPGMLVGLAVGAAAVAIVLARTVFRRH